jgi:cytochrome c oxidase subunit 4
MSDSTASPGRPPDVSVPPDLDPHDHDMRKHVRGYLAVFIALGVLTVVTVLMAYAPFKLAVGILIGLLIATVKGSLVALFFMHLSHERRFIYWALLLTAVFFIALIFLPIWAFMDGVRL